MRSRKAQIPLVAALALFAAVPLACGGDDDGDEASPAATRPQVGGAEIATNDPGVEVDQAGGTGGGSAGLSSGQPSLDVLEEIDPAAPSALAEGRGSCGSVDLVPTSGNLAQIDKTLICLINAERAARGLPALKHDRRLTSAARVHSRDMVKRRFFAHSSPSGDRVEDRVRAARYIRRGRFVVGENIAWGSGTAATPDSIVSTWMGSPPHRANILHPRYRQIGMATAPGSPVGSNSAASTFTATFGVVPRARRR